jgi:hypothetical protein
MGSAAEAIEAWNTRPEEDRLRSEVAELVAALRLNLAVVEQLTVRRSTTAGEMHDALKAGVAALSKHEGK